MNKPVPRILAFIPCYNEALSIGNLLQEFRAHAAFCDTLVIDDGSRDETYRIASQFSKAIRFDSNLGVPTAMMAAIRYARQNGYEHCIQLDGDGQHQPDQIPSFLASLNTGSANILIGSRYYKRIWWPFSTSKIAALICSLLVFMLFRQKWLYDPLSGMRMMDSKAMDYFIKHPDTLSLDAMVIPQALKGGLSVEEVAVNMRPRLYGSSHVAGFRGILFLGRLVFAMFRLRCKGFS